MPHWCAGVDYPPFTLSSAGTLRRPLATKSFQGEQKSRFSIGDNQFYELEKAHRNRLQAILNDEAIARAL